MKYEITIKDQDGIHTYEEEGLENLTLLLESHPGYEEVQAKVEKTEDKT